jgi:mannose-1-phosphate guanylyltransferase
MANLYAVILAGGSGTRFWPASRRAQPKQLLSFGPRAEQSLIAATVERLTPLCSTERIVIATGRALLEATRRALPALPEHAFLGEPAPRNTAACIGWATSIIERRDPDALVMVVPSDHHIGDEAAFREALERAVRSAESGPITTIGVEPTRAETGYGYLEAGEAVGEGVRRVARFVEKPDRARAEEYFKSGRHYWNSGMFFFRARAMREAVAQHMPELSAGLDRIDRARARGASAEQAETDAVFQGLQSISIDYGIMEKLSSLHVVPASFGWNDLGSWQSAWDLAGRDAAGNAAPPGTVLVDARGNLVHDLRGASARRVIALVGVDDLCVVETDDALLIIPRERAQDVRSVVAELERRGQTDKL